MAESFKLGEERECDDEAEADVGGQRAGGAFGSRREGGLAGRGEDEAQGEGCAGGEEGREQREERGGAEALAVLPCASSGW